MRYRQRAGGDGGAAPGPAITAPVYIMLNWARIALSRFWIQPL
jgi:hypothetical protein